MTVTLVVIDLNFYQESPPLHLVQTIVGSPEEIATIIAKAANHHYSPLLLEPARQLLLAVLTDYEQRHGSKPLSSHDVLSLLRDRPRLMTLLEDMASPGDRRTPHVAASMDLLRAFRHDAAFNATVETVSRILTGHMY